MRKYTRLIFIGIALGLLAFIAVTLLSDVSQLAERVMVFPWLILIPVLGLRVVNWILRFLKWHFFLWRVGVKNISLGDSAAVYWAGFPLAISPGKAAELLKCFIIYNITRTPVATTIPVVAAERLSDGMAVLLLIAWSIINLAAYEYSSVVYLALGLLVLLIVVLQIRPLCLALLRFLSNAPILGRFARGFSLFYESSYQLVLLPSLLFSVGLGTVANFLDGVGVYLILIGMGQPATSTTFFEALLVISLSVVAGSLSGMPGSIGASDLTITGTLQSLIKLSLAQAGFATLVIRFVQLWWGLLVGGAVAFFARKRLFPPSLEQAITEQEAQRTLQPALKPGD